MDNNEQYKNKQKHHIMIDNIGVNPDEPIIPLRTPALLFTCNNENLQMTSSIPIVAMKRLIELKTWLI